MNHFYKPTSPLGTVLYLTNKCNLRCKFCEIGLSNIDGERHEIKELSTSQLDKILDAMVRLGTCSIYITGGEPFLSKNLWYLFDLCSKNSITVDGITTNGSTLNKLSKEQIRLLNKAGVRRIIISLDHADAKKHDALRGRDGLFSNIETFLKSKDAERLNVRYCISCVISKENYMDLPALIRWCSTIKNIRHINFQPVCEESIFVDYKSDNPEKKSFLIDEERMSDFEIYLGAALKEAKRLNVSTTLPFLKLWVKEYFKFARTENFFFNKVMKGYVCSKPYNFLHINYNGDLLACTHIGPTGNINDGDVVDLWKNAAEKYRKILKKGKYFPKCRSCFCDFGTNYRYSLIYRPFKNADQILKVAFYYLQRYFKSTK